MYDSEKLKELLDSKILYWETKYNTRVDCGEDPQDIGYAEGFRDALVYVFLDLLPTCKVQETNEQ